MAKQIKNDEGKKVTKIYVADSVLRVMTPKGITIAQFKKHFVYNTETRRDMIKGFLVTSDEKQIRELERHPGFNKAFKETNRIPTTVGNKAGSIVAGVHTISAGQDQGMDVKAILDEEKKKNDAKINQVKAQSARFHTLKFSIVDTEKGGFLPGTSKKDQDEYLQLKEIFAPEEK